MSHGTKLQYAVGFPLYPSPPFAYAGNRIVSVVFESEAAALRRLVPEPLVPNPDQRAPLWVGRMRFDSGYSYLESGLLVPVTFGRLVGEYVVCLYLDTGGHPTPIVGGREIWGVPKVDAQITLTEEPERVLASVARGGTLLAQIELPLAQKRAPLPEAPGVPWICLKLIPSVREDQVPDVMQLTSLPFPTKIQAYATGAATVALPASAEDPLGRVPILKVVQGSFEVSDLLLGYGEVLFDYLAEKALMR